MDGASLRGDLVVLGAESVTVELDGLNEAPVASVLRNFSAPVLVDRAADEARDIALLARESDPFSIWDAAQRLLTADLKARYHGENPSIDALADALDTAATNEALEPELRALLLQIPSRVNLVEALGHDVDADKVDAAWRALAAALGQRLASALEGLHDAPAPASNDLSAEAAGRLDAEDPAQ